MSRQGRQGQREPRPLEKSKRTFPEADPPAIPITYEGAAWPFWLYHGGRPHECRPRTTDAPPFLNVAAEAGRGVDDDERERRGVRRGVAEAMVCSLDPRL